MFEKQDDPEFIKQISYIDFLIWVWWLHIRLWVRHSELNKYKNDDGMNTWEKGTIAEGRKVVVESKGRQGQRNEHSSAC